MKEHDVRIAVLEAEGFDISFQRLAGTLCVGATVAKGDKQLWFGLGKSHEEALSAALEQFAQSQAAASRGHGVQRSTLKPRCVSSRTGR